MAPPNQRECRGEETNSSFQTNRWIRVPSASGAGVSYRFGSSPLLFSSDPETGLCGVENKNPRTNGEIIMPTEITNPVEKFWREFAFQGGEILVPTSTVHYPWRRSYSGAWRCEGSKHSDHLGYDDDFARDRLTGGTYLLFRLGQQITPPES